MSDSNINNKEGQILKFLLKKHLEFSETEKYFVLEDQSGRKQLLNSKFYERYNFKIGQYINCRVDHINCSGKIFLEPEHPHYKEDDIYNFTIEKIEHTKNISGEDNLLINFIDVLGNTAFCIIEDDSSDNYTVGQSISCKLERIKKGKLYLRHINQKSLPKFKRGIYYKFVIDDIRILSDNLKYYVLSDDQNRTYLLNHEYYEDHNLKIGQTVDCTIIKFSSKGYYILEPKHPYYELDQEYIFEFIKAEKDSKADITGNYEITVRDIYNKDIKFISNSKFLITGKIPEKIKCKVTGIKKGKPLLDFQSPADVSKSVVS